MGGDGRGGKRVHGDEGERAGALLGSGGGVRKPLGELEVVVGIGGVGCLGGVVVGRHLRKEVEGWHGGCYWRKTMRG